MGSTRLTSLSVEYGYVRLCSVNGKPIQKYLERLLRHADLVDLVDKREELYDEVLRGWQKGVKVYFEDGSSIFNFGFDIRHSVWFKADLGSKGCFECELNFDAGTVVCWKRKKLPKKGRRGGNYELVFDSKGTELVGEWLKSQSGFRARGRPSKPKISCVENHGIDFDVKD